MLCERRTGTGAFTARASEVRTRTRSLPIAVVLVSAAVAACGAERFGDGTAPAQELAWLDARGQVLAVVPRSAATYSGIWLTPDESAAVVAFARDVEAGGGTSRLWRVDLATAESRTVSPASPGGPLASGATSPDRRVTHWSETHLVFEESSETSHQRDLWVGVGGLERYQVTPWTERGGQLSADGKWLAYVSEESDLPEVYVQTFPDATLGRWLVSGPGGGDRPAWRADSLAVFYWAPGGRFMRVPLKKGRVFVQPLGADVLFTMPEAATGVPFAVARDDRVLMAVPREVLAALGADVSR
jgi:hypothetical protein